jgi:hypothetical protein
MKKISTPPTTSSNKSKWKLLQKFSKTTWLLVVGIVLLNVGCFLPITALSKLATDFFNLVDIRTWSWWYFVCLIVVIAFSIRWYLLYQKHINNDFDPQSSHECKWFCILSGVVTMLIALIVFLHRFSLLRIFYSPLYFWFGYGDFSLAVLLIIATIITVVVVLVFLVWKWITTLPD